MSKFYEPRNFFKKNKEMKNKETLKVYSINNAFEAKHYTRIIANKNQQINELNYKIAELENRINKSKKNMKNNEKIVRSYNLLFGFTGFLVILMSFIFMAIDRFNYNYNGFFNSHYVDFLIVGGIILSIPTVIYYITSVKKTN